MSIPSVPFEVTPGTYTFLINVATMIDGITADASYNLQIEVIDVCTTAELNRNPDPFTSHEVNYGQTVPI